MVWMRPNAVTFLSRLVLFIIVSPGFVAARTVVHVGSQLSGILGTIGQEGGEVHNVRNGLDQTTALTDSIVRRGAGYGAVTLVAAEIHHGWPSSVGLRGILRVAAEIQRDLAVDLLVRDRRPQVGEVPPQRGRAASSAARTPQRDAEAGRWRAGFPTRRWVCASSW